MMQFQYKTVEELDLIIKKIIPKLSHKIILLEGDLGAGKTTFIQLLANQLESKDDITSPTYSIVNEYDYPGGKIYHFDLYRLNSIEETFDIGIEEYLYSGNYCLIEWPQIYISEIELDYHKICIFHDSKQRTLTIDI